MIVDSFAVKSDRSKIHYSYTPVRFSQALRGSPSISTLEGSSPAVYTPVRYFKIIQ